MKKRCLMIGAGGMASLWVREFWAKLSERVEIVALVDVSQEALNRLGDAAQIPAEARFASTREAMERVEADFCCIVTPPAFHREAVELACERNLDILSEKPIAATWEDCCSIYKTVKASGIRMMVTQNYRLTPRILTLKKAVAQLGAVNYVVARYASDYRVRDSWGKFRHEIPHTLLVEGGIHHLDQIRNLCSADVKTIAGYDWNPGAVRGGNQNFAGSDSFDGEPCGLYVLEMTGGAFASYEGNNLAAGKSNSWSQEAYRVECEGGAAVLDDNDRVTLQQREDGETTTREMPLETPQWIGHQAVAAQFIDWLEGGETPATTLSDNIQSNAALFAAIDASTRRQTIDVQKMLRDAVGEIV